MATSKALKFDRSFLEAIAAVGETGAALPQLPVGDVEGRRTAVGGFLAQMMAMVPPMPDVKQTQHEITASDGTTLILTEFRPSSAASTHSPAIYYAHGGGMILGSVTVFAPAAAVRAQLSGLPIFAIEYRLAPEDPHPIPVQDCYDGLTWLSAHASEVGIDNARIMILGESAGGGLAAGVALMARDKQLEPPLAYQMLIYPMLDDRNLAPIPEIEHLASWKCDDNQTGWGALLGKAAGSDDEIEGHAYAAPARAKSLAGLPPTYIDVGQLDIFGPEDILYASRLMQAGVQVEFHLYPGLPHGFEGAAPQTEIVKGAMANRQRVTDEFKRAQ
ncbi:hypothetical protein LTR53_012063 [Teratosphaeriaceae sp. CCFEE 6253]|nr:hypothetical protein LTR53_012063 [Teratosphaeriaceae sp. CCFEE 6253]